MEPQERGAWHAHVLVRFEKPIDRIDYDMLRETWGHGRIHVEELRDVDNLGSYFVAYMKGLEIKPGTEHEYEGDIREKNGKKYIKGERLKFYPDYFKIYRASKGIEKPTGETPRGKKWTREFPRVTYEKDTTFTEVARDGNAVDLTIVKQQRKKGGE
jgi:hypothetical protein